MDNRQVIEWDKDDIDALKFMKVDVLGLGMLGCMRRAFDLLDKAKGTRLDLATIPAEDPATYAMIRKADTMGTFQIESRAQMSMLPRLKPKTFYDLVIEVAIVRPGPIQGDMVHPYIRRREGKEAVHFPTPALEKVLGKTLGVPLFQEQAMQVAMVAAGFSPTEADQLRRVDGDVQIHRRRPQVSGQAHHRHARQRLHAGIRRTHLPAAGRLRQLRLSGIPCRKLRADRLRLKLDEMPSPGCVPCRDPQRPADGLLRARAARARCARARRRGPAGRYQPFGMGLHAGANRTATITPCALASAWCAACSKKDAERIVAHYDASQRAPYASQRRRSLAARHRAGRDAATASRAADGFRGLGLSRREAAWAIKGLRDEALPLFAAADDRDGHAAARSDRAGRHACAHDARAARWSRIIAARASACARIRSPFCAKACTSAAIAPARRCATAPNGQPHFHRRACARPADAGLGQGRHVHHAGR